ncbi:MAG: hypothetical protein UZ02_AOB001001845 [Nitrosomonas europaea]|nr:MAG: hypothetical protein UZ02_AOB001001845 [Nitrosomonas europaea]
MMFGFAEIFRAPVGQHTEQGDLFFCEERQGYTVEVRKISVHKGLLVNLAHSLAVANIVRIL